MSSWNNNWKGNYWGGRKKQPRTPQTKKKPEKPQEAIPAYDSDKWALSSSGPSSSAKSSQSTASPSVSELTKLLKTIVEAGKFELPEEAKTLLAAQADAEVKGDMQKEQKLLNAKRKAHNKLQRLKDAVDRKKEKFKVYKLALKEQLAKETERFENDLASINKAIAETELHLEQLENGMVGEKEIHMEPEEMELENLLESTDGKEKANLHAKVALAEKEKQEMEDKYEAMNAQLIAMQMQYQSLQQQLRAPMGSTANAWNISPVGSEELGSGPFSPQLPKVQPSAKVDGPKTPLVAPFARRERSPRRAETSKAPCGLDAANLSKLE